MNLGRLEKIELRNIWKTEDQDFTPWLAREDNISLLADALGLELEVEAEEKEVGPFRADILCKDTGNDSWVLIENQLERTDHKHLGQLMTYAAGLQAVTIVWVATRFTDEHRQALDWLNRITEDDFRFFGLEVELWRIGDSPPAPKFNIVSKPNEWSRAVGAATRRLGTEGLTDARKLQLAYWQELHAYLKENKKVQTQKPRAQHWTNLAIGRSGMRLGAVLLAREEQIGIELYLGDDNADAFFDELHADKTAIEQALGFNLDWRRLPERRASRIVFFLEKAPLSDRNRWPEYREWMGDKLEAFDSVFRPRVKSLDADAWRTDNPEFDDKE